MTADALTQEYYQRREGLTTIGRQAKLCSPGEFYRLYLREERSVSTGYLVRTLEPFIATSGLERREGNIRGSASSGLPIEQQQVDFVVPFALWNTSRTIPRYLGSNKQSARHTGAPRTRRSGTSKGSGITSQRPAHARSGQRIIWFEYLKRQWYNLPEPAGQSYYSRL